MIRRRKLGAATVFCAAVLTSSCGFHPLYAPGGGAQAALGAVYVDRLPNRNGQLLRQALQERLEGTDDTVSKRYKLYIYYTEATQTLGVQTDNSTTRNRDIGTAVWTLRPLDNAALELAHGSVRSVDGYNIIDEQYFYIDLSSEATARRQAQALADQIVTGIAAYFQKHPDKA